MNFINRHATYPTNFMVLVMCMTLTLDHLYGMLQQCLIKQSRGIYLNFADFLFLIYCAFHITFFIMAMD